MSRFDRLISPKQGGLDVLSGWFVYLAVLYTYPRHDGGWVNLLQSGLGIHLPAALLSSKNCATCICIIAEKLSIHFPVAAVLGVVVVHGQK